MSVVEMPDGSRIAFPDSMSDEAINEALKDWKPAPASAPAPGAPAATSPAPLSVSSLGDYKNALTSGLAKGLGFAGSLEQLGDQAGAYLNRKGLLPDWMVKSLDPSSDGWKTLFPTPQDITTATGVGGTPPTGVGPKLVEGAIGGAVPAALTGGISAIPAGMGAGAGSGIADEALSSLMPNAPSALKIGTGLLGGLAGARSGVLAQRAGNSLMGSLNPQAEGVTAAGLPLSSPALTAESPGTRASFGPYADVPGIKQDIGGVIERTADELGPARTWQEAGEDLQSKMQNWKDTVLPEKLATLSRQIDNVVPGSSPVDMSPLVTTLNKMTGEAGALQGLQDKLVPRLPSQLKDALTKTIEGQSPPISGMGLPGELPPTTWNDARTVRSAIGDILGAAKQYGITEEQASKLYATMSDVMRKTATDYGAPGASATFDSANGEFQRLYNFRSQLADSVLAEGKEPGAIVQKLLRTGRQGDVTLDQLFNEIPDARGNLASVALRQHGLADATDSASSAADNFGKRWIGGGTQPVLSPEAKSTLFGDSGATQLDALAQVHNSVAKLPLEAPTSSENWVKRLGAAMTGGAITGLAGRQMGFDWLESQGVGEAAGIAAEATRVAALKRLATSGLAGSVLAGSGPGTSTLGRWQNPVLSGVGTINANQ